LACVSCEPAASATWRAALPVALPGGPTVVASAHVHLEPELVSVPLARRWVAAHAAGIDSDASDVLLLLTSELVTNAVIHARTEVELALTATSDDVLVCVHDLDLGRREQRTHERDGGRGLALVASLADAYGLLQHPQGGKTWWFRLTKQPSLNPTRAEGGAR